MLLIHLMFINLNANCILSIDINKGRLSVNCNLGRLSIDIIMTSFRFVLSIKNPMRFLLAFFIFLQ